MRKSLFRIVDVLELCIAYIFCFFLNVLLDYAKTLDLDSYILKAFVKNFIDYQPLIVLLFTFIVIVFHYQMLHRKKAEIFCKILVGDTVFHITIRYALDCIMILAFAYILSVLANVYLNFNLTSSLYLVPILITYILISARQVRKYENF
ncbi:hypothetical protein D7X87_21715 [bacterium D16-54]|jgi:hypothetical protein|nr:hypothetical protein D7X87_21715 [bacterium D16-54]RKJ11159.1 hypothetical protein D7X65_21930 [bacterium D16-56]